MLSTDGGVSFPIVLLENTANNGSADIVVPNNVTNSARIMVAATDNIFYNVNTANFTISSSDPTFIVNNLTGTVDLCSVDASSASYDISVDFINNFSEDVSFSTTGEPIGSSVSFTPTSINSDGTVTMTVSDLTGVGVDSYLIEITASSSTIVRNINASLNILNATFETLNLTSPDNNDTGISLTPTFTWDEISNASSYDIEIATDSDFSSIVASENSATNSFTGVSLNQATTYYWRVKAKNTCGDGDFSSTSSFTTQNCSVCESSGNTAYVTSTTRVVFNTIDNPSDKPGAYSDYTDISTSVKPDEVHDLTVQVNTDGNYTVHTLVWIDWNQDCDFDDANEEYDLGTALNVEDAVTTLSPLSVTIPSDALLGSTTMRVSTKYNSDPTSCMTGEDAEVEDYTIEVIDETASLDNDAFEGFNLYPNPSNGNFNLQFDTTSTDRIELQLFDITGRLVRELLFTNVATRFSESISFENTAKGVYLLKIKNGNKQTTKKLVIE